MVRIEENEIDTDESDHRALFEAASPEDAFEDWLKLMVTEMRQYQTLQQLARIPHPTIEVVQLNNDGTRGNRWWDYCCPDFSIPPLALEALIADYLTATRKQGELQ